MREVVTSIPVPRPRHNVHFTVTPTDGVVSHGLYTWGAKYLKDANGDEVVPQVEVVPAMYWHQVGVLLTFTATVVPALDNPTIVEYYWDFGDGVQISTTSPTVTHTYVTKSPNTIAHLRARDDKGISAWSSMNLMLTS
jgi:hypothetical protein